MSKQDRSRNGKFKRSLTVEERFWSKVDKSGECWIWTATLSSVGYGNFWHKGTMAKTHRVAYELTYGPIPPNLLVCHRCDNRKCVRPEHLFLGTDLDNFRDCKQKGRHAWGEKAGSARLTREQVLEIRQKYEPYRVTQKMLAKEYGISKTSVGAILRGENWAELGGRKGKQWSKKKLSAPAREQRA